MRPDTVVSASLIREARMRAGLTQAQLSERCGKAKVQIGRWETGAVAPSFDTLLEIIRACGLDLPVLLKPYQPIDDRRLAELQRLSPERRVDEMLRRLRTNRAITRGAGRPRFDPRAILGALQRREVDFILIGGLSRIARGADEITTAVDICPSVQDGNLERLDDALDDLGGRHPELRGSHLSSMDRESMLRVAEVEAVPTRNGELKLVVEPAGVPRGYDALRVGATGEHLGDGLRTAIASTGDLITMASALGRPEDLERIPALRQILTLEAEPGKLVEPESRPSSDPFDLRRPKPRRGAAGRGSRRGRGGR